MAEYECNVGPGRFMRLHRKTRASSRAMRLFCFVTPSCLKGDRAMEKANVFKLLMLAAVLLPVVAGAQTPECTMTVINETAASVTVYIDPPWTSYLVEPGPLHALQLPLYGPARLCIWECIWNVDHWDCAWDCYKICPGGAYYLAPGMPGGDISLGEYSWSEANCDTPAVTVSLPPSPYQSVWHENGPYGEEAVIELRNSILPQALNLWFGDLPACTCAGETIQKLELVPRSLTGPVFQVRNSGVYFLIDNLCAPGYYDLRVTCAGGGEEMVRANVHYIGYQGYVPSDTLVNAVTGNTIRGARVSIWQRDELGFFNRYDGMIASDGTYYFDVPSGIYKILAQYELAGEWWSEPFVVNSPIPPNTMPPLVPVTDDVVAPVVQLYPIDPSRLTGRFDDTGVGIAVVEVVPGSMQNIAMALDYYQDGDSTVGFQAGLEDTTMAGSATLRCIDRLGNLTEQVIELVPVSTSVSQSPASSTLRLLPCYPNPFNPTTTIAFDVPRQSHVVLRVLDITGRMVGTVLDRQMEPGTHRLVWDGRSSEGTELASGVYFLRLEVGDFVATRKMVLLK
jgi:hypothetical protein